MGGPILAIEQSGSVCRAVVFSPDRRVLSSAQETIAPSGPRPGFVEYEPDEIWSAVIATSRAALVQARADPGAIAAIGIVGDPYTALLWETETGVPVHQAIASDDRRTEVQCRALREAAVDPVIRGRTGLRLDSARAAPKLAWLLDNVDGARALAEQGRLAFGGAATYLLWRLTDGRVHAIDATSAAATLLFDLAQQRWDDALLDIFSVPASILPEIFDNSTYFGAVDSSHFGGSGPIGVHSMAAVDQAVMLGHAGIAAGSLSLNLGSGCTALLGTGGERGEAGSRDQITIGRRIDGKVSYAKLAANAAAADAFQWARRTFELPDGASAADSLAASSDNNHNAQIVPGAITSGFPWFQGSTRGLILGLVTTMSAPDLGRAALESFVFAANDLVEALVRGLTVDGKTAAVVSGGLAGSDWAMQFLADILDRPVERPAIAETAALGVAWLAGVSAGLWNVGEERTADLTVDRRFEPQLDQAHRRSRIDEWRYAVGIALAAKSTSAA